MQPRFRNVFAVLRLGLHFEIPFIFNRKLLFMNYVIKIVASRYPSLHACGWRAGAENHKINDDKVKLQLTFMRSIILIEYTKTNSQIT